MSVHDDDILDFDFVDDETQERPPPRTGGSGGRGGGDGHGTRPPRPPSRFRGGAHGLTPLLRLIGLAPELDLGQTPPRDVHVDAADHPAVDPQVDDEAEALAGEPELGCSGVREPER